MTHQGLGMIKAVIFDFGGVLAEEGFKNGLKAIGKKHGLDPEDFFRTAEQLIYETGYVTGMCPEHRFWSALREKAGITGSDEDLREEILQRFILRPEMIQQVDKIKSSGLFLAILSDQTNWLDEINERSLFYNHFDFIFNSYRMKKSKRDPSIFRDVCSLIGLKPSEVLFIDDNGENIKRALGEGLEAIHYKNKAEFEKAIGNFI
ncbi:MAG TPA: HAD family phosphatase [Nitrospiraceae bacterium]|jgi:putative hydrolase of the HAD superfamily|nr:HAD family phosphatase [Nitrospiraceae bacterium]